MAQTLTTERIRGWQERAAQARLAKEARAGRRARRGRRGWDLRRIRVPAITGLASPSSGPASPVTAQRDAAAGRSAGADGRQPAPADGRQPATADELGLATADEHQPMTAGAGQPGADGRQPAGPRAA